MFKREIFHQLLPRLQEPRQFIQVLTGPRQVGKTILAGQLSEALNIPTDYASADTPGLESIEWLQQQWDGARFKLAAESAHGRLLILDEVQKVPQWSEKIKQLWDEDTAHHVALKVMILGSSPWLLQQGLIESLAGRFENTSITHWSYSEMHSAFGWNLDQYCYFGGYPGAAPLIDDEPRWRHYLRDALIETTLSRDILLMNRVHKPALLRQVFQLACDYSSQIFSYQKMLGQFNEAGNTTTLSHYLELLSHAGMVCGISKFSTKKINQRTSSPKLQVFNTGLISALHTNTFDVVKMDRQYWGRLVESTVGAHLINQIQGSDIELTYWREGNDEVDFVLQRDQKIIAIEVKSGQQKSTFTGATAFMKQHPSAHFMVVGSQGIPLDVFFAEPISRWFDSEVN